MKIRKILCMIIACVLAIVFFCQEPMRLYANSKAEIHIYLKDIKLITDCTKEEAEKWFKDNGYILSDSQFVKDAYGDSAFLGYKTTDDKNEAITDIRVMNMLGGNKIIDFNENLENKFTESFNEGATKLKNAFAEFKKNVEADEAGTRKSPLAKGGKELLNQLTYKETPLYDYLVSSTCTLNDYKRIIAVTTTETLSYIFFCMMMGVFFDADHDFQDELDKNKLFAVKPTDDYGALDASFYDDAKDLYESFKQFAELYALAVENYDKDVKVIKALDTTTTITIDDVVNKTTAQEGTGGIIIINDDETKNLDLPSVSDQSAASESTISQASSMAEVDALKSDEDAAASHIYALNAYDILSKYTITSDYAENLAEYIVKLASMEDKDEGVRMLYPLIDMLTPGQLLALKSVGIQTFVLFLENNTEDTYDIFHDKLSEVSDGTTFSVFTDVDTDLYDRICAYTDVALREEAAGNRYVYESRDHDGDHKATAMKMQRVLAITSMVCGGIVVLGSVAIAIGGGSLFSAFSLAIAAISFMSACGAACVAGVALVAGGCCLALSIAVAVAIVVILIVWLVNKFSDDEPDPIERTEIPEILYDYDNDSNAFIKYEVLTDPVAKEPVDIANEKNVEWDAIYYTYSENRGSPIVIKDNKLFTENLFNASVDKMMPLVRFSDTLHAGDVKRCYGSEFIHLYLYYYTEASLAGTAGGTTLTDGVYISDIKMAEGESQNAARDQLTNEGYTVIDQDLTPHVKGVWTYIGYKTTKDVEHALTDIRVGFNINTDEDKYVLGKASYGRSGTLKTGASIHITRSELAGTPILADAGLIIVDDRSNAPAGYEPVSLFCGGDAFDFCFCVDQTEHWDSHLYIYYRPSTTYTSGTEYISGLATVNAKTVGSYSVEDYIAACGFKNINPTYIDSDVNLFYQRTGAHWSAFGREDGLYEDYITRMVYSTTYNPYRAITDVQIMEYSCSMTAALSSITYGGKAYAVCESFQQGMLAFGRTIRKDKSYLPTTQNGTDWYGDENYAKYGYKSTEGDGKGSFARNFYVTACTGDTPIKSDEIAFCKNADTPEELVKQKPELGDASEWQGVHEFGHPYDSDALNLYHTIYYYWDGAWWVPYTATVDYHFNMFIKRETPERPQYVKSIVVCSCSDDETCTNDTARIDAISGSVGELIEYNFAETSDNQWRTVSYYQVDGDDTRHYNINRYKKNGNSSYLYITYTNDKLEALREIRLVKEEDVTSPKIGSILKYQVWDYKENEPAKSQYSKDDDSYVMIPFTCCGGLIKNSKLGSYYIYTSTNSFFGNPITEVYFNGNKLDIGSETACWFDGSIVEDSEYYFHSKRETNSKDARYASDVAVYSGKSQRECLDKLYDDGCDTVFNYNFSTDGGYCYLGYKEQTTALYNDVITGLTMVSIVDDMDHTEMEDMVFTRYSLNEDKEIESTYTCLNSDGSMGRVTLKVQIAIDGSSDLTMEKEATRYRYLYGTYDDKLCSGVMMNTLTVAEGSDSIPDLKSLDGYEGLVVGVGTGEIKIKNKRANTSVKSLYNIYKYGTSWSSQYVIVKNVVEETVGNDINNIGCANGLATMWYKNAETFYNKTFTGDVAALFDTVYTDNQALTLYPDVKMTDYKMDGKYILFKDFTTDSTLVVPDGADVTIWLRGNSITCKGASTFLVEKGASLTLTGDKTKKGGVYTYSTSSDASGVPESCVTVNGKLTATNVNFDACIRDYGDARLGAYSVIDYSGEGMTLTNCNFHESHGWLKNGFVYAHGGDKITITGCTFKDAIIDGGNAPVSLIGVNADITNCTFTNTVGSNGGAISIQNNSTVNVKSCTIEDCETHGYTEDTNGDGGGIYVLDSTLNLTDTDIINCSAECRGGGIFARNANCKIKDCNITSNNAGWLGGGIYAYLSEINIEGGSISANNASEGGGLYANDTNCKIKDCSITSNTSETSGGGICADSAEIDIEGGSISKNKSYDGGGIYAIKSDLTLTDTDITECFAGCRGGGLYLRDNTDCKIKDCDIKLNTADWLGGGIYAYAVDLDIEGSSISENNASEGGGIIIAYLFSSLTLTDTQIKNNTATNAYAGVDVESGITQLNLNGIISIVGNTANGKASNLCLPEGQFMTLRLDQKSKIGIQSASKDDVVRLTILDVPRPVSFCFFSDTVGTLGLYKGEWLALVRRIKTNNNSVTPTAAPASSAVATVFADGNVWIITIGVATLAVALGVLVIFYKKKKSKSTVDITDNEENRR